LIKGASGEYHLQKDSPAINASKGTYSAITTDMDGQTRNSLLDTGADEYSAEGVKAKILNPADVGYQAGKNR